MIHLKRDIDILYFFLKKLIYMYTQLRYMPNTYRTSCLKVNTVPRLAVNNTQFIITVIFQ